MTLHKYFVEGMLLFALSVSFAEAHIPTVVTQESLHDITQVIDPEVSQAFYGMLEGSPHTFELRSSEPFTLDVELLLPDMEGVSLDTTGIIIRETGTSGRVAEVARLLGKDASWEGFFEPWGGDHYLRGETYTGSAQPGVYRIEVSTPDNRSPYVLVIGKEETWGEIGYFEMLGRIAAVKTFYGKSQLMVIESRLVYIPLICLLIFIGALLFMRRRRHTLTQS